MHLSTFSDGIFLTIQSAKQTQNFIRFNNSTNYNNQVKFDIKPTLNFVKKHGFLEVDTPLTIINCSTSIYYNKLILVTIAGN
jgi:hypothetical protein